MRRIILRLTVLVSLMVLFVSLPRAQAGQYNFRGIPGGDFSVPGFSNNVPFQLYFGQGAWKHDGSSANASATIVSTEADRYMELDTAWYPRVTSAYYICEISSAADDHWIVSADLKVTLADNGNADRIFAIGSSISELTFSLNFMYPTTGDEAVVWRAGSLSGTNSSLTARINGSYETVSIEYDGLIGAAKAFLGREMIFDVITETGLAGMDTVYFRKHDRGTFDRGEFLIDNVVASSVPPVSLLILSSGFLFFFRKQNHR